MSDQVLEPEEHVLSTLEKDGSRRWMYPRLFKGKFWNRRRIVGYFLIVLFIVLPHLQVNSRPAIFLNITRREFTIFGFTFLPTDTLLLAFFMISVFLSIFLLTALFGRCGAAGPVPRQFTWNSFTVPSNVYSVAPPVMAANPGNRSR
ncbi:hypothetical protein [Gimesia benthica]|uniref:hypothetical protein n=1 Tax=Gimesia benthica TaxID=2608982 RepID=UPI001D14B545|nr:hypothetical protein [Gimesia benthica]